MLPAMGACLFVASGLQFDVDAYLPNAPFKPASVFRRDEVPRKESVGRPDSGFLVLLAEGGLSEQVTTARHFLARHATDLETMRRLGVDHLMFEFAVERGSELQQTEYLPPELIVEMGQSGMALSMSTVQLPRG